MRFNTAEQVTNHYHYYLFITQPPRHLGPPWALPEPSQVSSLLQGELKLYSYPARALRALGLLLADGALTVGWGKTFWGIGRVPSRKRA